MLIFQKLWAAPNLRGKGGLCLSNSEKSNTAQSGMTICNRIVQGYEEFQK